MDQNGRAGFLIGLVIGFDLDSDDAERILREHGLSMDKDDLIICQKAIREHVGETRWQNGLKLIFARMNASDLN